MVCGEEVRYGPKRSAKGTEDEWCWPWHGGGISGGWRSKWHQSGGNADSNAAGGDTESGIEKDCDGAGENFSRDRYKIIACGLR